MEMETRWNKKQKARSDLSPLPIHGKWHDYLRHCGLKPSTYRGWKKGYYDAIALTSPQLGEESASLPSSDALTSVQKEVISALVDQGYRQSNARALVTGVKGNTFTELFKNCLANRLKPGDRHEQPAPATAPEKAVAAAATPDAVKLGAGPSSSHEESPNARGEMQEPPQPSPIPGHPASRPEESSLPKYEFLANALYEMAIAVADLYLSGWTSFESFKCA